MSRQLEIGLFAENVVRRDGQGRVMLEIAVELLRRGHRVHVFAINIADELQGRVTWHRAPSLSLPQLIRDFVYATWARLASRGVHLDAALTMGACARPSGAPVCYYAAFTHAGWFARWSESGFEPGTYHRIHSVLLRRSERRALRSARQAVAISERVAQELQSISADTSMHVVPAGVDINEFSHRSDREQARQQLGLDAQAFCVGLIGEHSTGRKGLEDLARAIVKEGDGDERIVVHGHGPVERTLEKMRRIGMDGRVHFPDPGIPVPSVLAACDMVAVPSIYEPFSLVALEALAAGVPVVVSERAGVAELLGPSDAALVVDARDPGSLGGAIIKLKRDPRLAADLVERARLVIEKLSWPEVSARVASVLESTAAGRAE